MIQPIAVPHQHHSLAIELGSKQLKQVDELILQLIKQEIPLIHDVAEHIIASGGKRLRPRLTLLSSMSLGYEGGRHIQLAAAVEFMHTATLLHDDVVDDSNLRRGLATANNVWGNKPSVLVGDFLLSQAFRLMVQDGSIEVLDILSNAAAVISKGEVLQLTTENKLDTSLETYIDVVQAKTAELFAAACEIAPVIAGKSDLRAAYRQYGLALGIAFQAVDDMLDYDADQEKLGKEIGDDFKEKKVTLPVILLRDALPANERAVLANYFVSDYQQKPGDLLQVKAWLDRYNIMPLCSKFARHYCEQATQAAGSMPQNTATDALTEIITYGLSRTS